MSEEYFTEFYYHQQFDGDGDHVHDHRHRIDNNQRQMFDASYLSYSEFFHGPTHDHQNSFSGSLGLSPPPPPPVGGGETPATPNSSISSASTEAAENDQNPNKGKREVKGLETTLEDGEDNNDSSKNDAKVKKKGAEKKQRPARFAFMTKSEVDHLEDGYRWRKYGQKAVKHSPYPRSYYRCTTQKCLVKKRVERSFEDPSMVITTYEGQHNHHIPVTLRGNVAAGIFAPSMLSPPFVATDQGPSFSQELLYQMPQYLYGYGGTITTSNDANNNYQQSLSTSDPQQQLNDQHFPADCGLLQDITPPVFPKHET